MVMCCPHRIDERRRIRLGVIEKPGAATTSADLDRFRLRRFVESLGDELETRDAPTDLTEVAAALEANPRAVHFRKVGPEQQELVGNVTASRSRLARAFGVAPDRLMAEVNRRLRNKPAVVEITAAQAPAQEVVLTGDDADLTALPVHLQHG